MKNNKYIVTFIIFFHGMVKMTNLFGQKYEFECGNKNNIDNMFTYLTTFIVKLFMILGVFNVILLAFRDRAYKSPSL